MAPVQRNRSVAAKPVAAQVSRDRSFAWRIQFHYFPGLKIRQRSFAGDNQFFASLGQQRSVC